MVLICQIYLRLLLKRKLEKLLKKSKIKMVLLFPRTLLLSANNPLKEMIRRRISTQIKRLTINKVFTADTQFIKRILRKSKIIQRQTLQKMGKKVFYFFASRIEWKTKNQVKRNISKITSLTKRMLSNQSLDI